MRSTSGDLLHCFAFRHFPLFPQFQERNEEVQMLDNFDIFMCNFLLNKVLLHLTILLSWGSLIQHNWQRRYSWADQRNRRLSVSSWRINVACSGNRRLDESGPDHTHQKPFQSTPSFRWSCTQDYLTASLRTPASRGHPSRRGFGSQSTAFWRGQ